VSETTFRRIAFTLVAAVAIATLVAAAAPLLSPAD
jgi:hypothetical protein